MNRNTHCIARASLRVLLLLLVGCIHGACPLEAAENPTPNIILVMPDDVGVGDYACLGNPVIRTPSVDAFRQQSLLFTQFHVSPTCPPTRSALMSARHEFKNGVTHTMVKGQVEGRYDQWWNEVQPLLVNESVVGPKVNPFKELHWTQFGGEPDEKLLQRMSSQRKSTSDSSAAGGGKKRRKNRKEQ